MNTLFINQEELSLIWLRMFNLCDLFYNTIFILVAIPLDVLIIFTYLKHIVQWLIRHLWQVNIHCIFRVANMCVCKIKPDLEKKWIFQLWPLLSYFHP